MEKILKLKCGWFQVSQNEDGTLTLMNEAFDASSRSGQLIASLGGIEATLARCEDSEESFAEIVAKRKAQRLIDSNVGKLVGQRGERCDVGERKFATVDGVLYSYQSPRGWHRAMPDSRERAIARQKEADKLHQEQEQEYLALVDKQPIPVTLENIETVMRHLRTKNWGSWVLPKMDIGYSAHQYDCDGVTAVTITLDEAIDVDGEPVRKFSFGAPRGHLNSYCQPWRC